MYHWTDNYLSWSILMLHFWQWITKVSILLGFTCINYLRLFVSIVKNIFSFVTLYPNYNVILKLEVSLLLQVFINNDIKSFALICLLSGTVQIMMYKLMLVSTKHFHFESIEQTTISFVLYFVNFPLGYLGNNKISAVITVPGFYQ